MIVYLLARKGYFNKMPPLATKLAIKQGFNISLTLTLTDTKPILSYLFFATSFACIVLICSASIDPTKKLGHHRYKRWGYPVNARNIAGPGHRPANPHPSPKSNSPMIKLLSIVLFVGTLKPADLPFWLTGHSSAPEFCR